MKDEGNKHMEVNGRGEVIPALQGRLLHPRREDHQLVRQATVEGAAHGQGGQRRTSRLDRKRVIMRTHSMVHQPYYMEVVEQGNTNTLITTVLMHSSRPHSRRHSHQTEIVHRQ